MEKLYHIHRDGCYDELYYPGSTFKVGKKPNRLYNSALNRSSSYVADSKKEDGKTINYRKNIIDVLDPDVFLTLPIQKQIYYLGFVRAILHNDQLDYREAVFEYVRANLFPTRPSRLTCMWLADEDSLSTWKNIIDKNREGFSIYEMKVDGNLFVTRNSFLPEGFEEPLFLIEYANRYWNRSEDMLKNADDREYLFEGVVTVGERVK